MDAFDAACHTLSAISTGGFPTKQASIAFFNSPYTEYVITIQIMFFGGTNFKLLYTFFTLFSFLPLQGEEFRWYVGIIMLFTVGITALLLSTGEMEGLEQTFRTALFQVIAAITRRYMRR
jgi:trk system potassium uptake protein TrkH